MMSGFWEAGPGTDFQIVMPWEVEPIHVTSAGMQAALHFVTFIILYNTLIPISLYVSVEIIRMGQSWLIDWDVQMWDATTDTPAVARTTTLNEELGQIQYIFSDKTGTLTQNIMMFLKCTIDGTSYGIATTEASQGAALAAGGAAGGGGGGGPGGGGPGEEEVDAVDFSWNKHANPTFEFFDQSMIDKIRKDKDEKVHRFFKHLALCHTVVVEKEEETGRPIFKAQSPDEEALVSAACNFGFVFVERTPSTVEIEIVDGGREKYELLDILEFNSDRKRMSIILRDPTGRT